MDFILSYFFDIKHMSSFDCLPLDILIEIASYNRETWYKLYRMDDRFHDYARGNVGINKFISKHTEIVEEIGRKTLLFGRLHSINDEPSYVVNGYKYWHRNGRIHRGDDKPAYIAPDGSQVWYINGKRHREGDKPAIIRADGYKAWYNYERLHRVNGPAEISRWSFDTWYTYGKFVK